MRLPPAALGLLACAAGALAPTARAAPPSIPVEGPVDVDLLLRVARFHESENARLYYQYTFRQTTLIETLDTDGNVKKSRTEVYRVIPSPQGTEAHLIAKNGADPTPHEVAKQERQNARLKRRWEKIREKSKKDQARQPSTPGAPRKAAAATATASPSGSATHPGAAPAAASPAVPPATQPAAPASSSAPPTPAALTPRVAEGPPAPPAPTPPPAPAGPPIPECDLDDPVAHVRPPRPAPFATAPHHAAAAPDPTRRQRQSAGDYTLFELLSLTDYDYAGTCRLGDRTAHVVAFAPPATFDPANPVERVMTAMKGAILIDATEFEVLRAEGRTVAPIKWGAGLVALRSAHVVFESDKVNGEVWLPVRDVFDFDSRVLLAQDHERITQAYDDYKKATVNSTEEYGPPVDEPPRPGPAH